MANSVQSLFTVPMTSLGYVNVPTSGTPVRLTVNVDANNNYAPETPVGPGTTNGPNYTPTGHRLFFQGYHPAANNNGMILNTGNVYLMMAAANNGSGNKTDSGAMLFVIPPGGTATWPASEVDRNTISPYKFYLDADSNNEGALVTMQVG